MNLYRTLVFPMISRSDPEWAHGQTIRSLGMAAGIGPGRAMLRSIAGKTPNRPIKFCGLTFPNVLGVAAGLDKNVECARALFLLGFGHVEVGTLTPRPQVGNPRPRLFRLPAKGAVINRMGFPNCGVKAALPRLRALQETKGPGIVGVSLGKQKETPLEEAAGDYLSVMRAVYPYSDYLAVNISSPNTPGLRELQGGRFLTALCSALVEESAVLGRKHGQDRKPLLVKIAPDLSAEELEEIVSIALETGIDGIVATNTTLSREGVSGSVAGEAGGLSGRPLAEKSRKMIADVHRHSGGKLPIIGVGGIDGAAEARRKLAAGAGLLQIYSALVFEGPGLAGCLLRGLSGAARPDSRSE